VFPPPKNDNDQSNIEPKITFAVKIPKFYIKEIE
jgi:hypothetical protein